MLLRLLIASLSLIGCSTAPAAEKVSFTREVVPTLTRLGCNSGACHGTPSGKNGFRLSLRGYDPAVDISALVREANGRRLDRVDPDQSLILLKGTARASHEGGRKLDPDGRLYQLLRTWIAQGALDDRAKSSRPTSLKVTPPEAIIDSPASTQQLHVEATFPDGVNRDVTHLTRFAVNDELVARIRPEGTVERLKSGEVVVTAEYMGLMKPVVILFRDPNPNYRWPAVPEVNFIDIHIDAKLRKLQIAPTPLCGDEVFLRRAYLDAIGRLPTPAEIREFLADHRSDKRAAWIDRLLAMPAFADWWAQKWADRLGVNQRFVGKIGAIKYHQWIRASMAANVAEDVFVRSILTAGGGNYTNPAAGFFRRLRDPQLRAEEIAQLFLGVRMQCARCHNHPGESWTQEDYYSLAAFFAQVQYRDGPFFVGIYDKEETVLSRRELEVTHPRTGVKIAPKYPGGPQAALSAGADRRGSFASWLTAPGNPYFARASANRIWFHLFGRGIVEPVDDARSTNPPSIPALLDALAADLERHHYDRKHLIRTIMNSRTYQATGSATPDSRDDGRYFSRSIPRRLNAEALLDAVCDATGVPEKFQGFPKGTRAVQLPDGEFPYAFLRTFGRPPRASACECERGSDTTLHMALMLEGGDFLQTKLASPTGRVASLVKSCPHDSELIEELYLLTLSRLPSAAEQRAALTHLARHPERPRQNQVEDLMHALLNHPEFLFQH